MAQILVGVDLGGTNVRFGIVTPKGRVLEKGAYASNPSQEGVSIVGELVSNLKSFIQKRSGKNNQLLGIGIGMAGAIDMKKGKIINSPNIPSLNGFGIREFIRKGMSSPIAIENDANVFALGEGWVGAAKGSKHFWGLRWGQELEEGSSSMEKCSEVLKGWQVK